VDSRVVNPRGKGTQQQQQQQQPRQAPAVSIASQLSLQYVAAVLSGAGSACQLGHCNRKLNNILPQSSCCRPF
jgi:hypothetical protein